jgi:hypothetical protein
MIDVEPLIVSGLDRLVPLPRGERADWQDALRRAGLGSPRRLRWFLPNASGRLRLAIALVVIGLLLAGVAAAAYVGVNLVFETPPTTLGSGGEDGWGSFALAPGGHDLYAIRVPGARQLPPPGTPAGEPPVSSVHPGAPQLVRIDGIDRSGELQPQLVLDLDFGDLARQGFSIQTGSGGAVAAAGNGDIFLDVPARHPWETLFVLHRNGERQAIIDGRDLIEAGLFPADGGVSFRIAASAPDRLWLLAEPWEGDSPQRLFEVIDPNGDGDWSDRVLRPIALPDSLPLAKPWQRTSWNSFPDWSWQLAAEPPVPGDDRSHSVLAAVSNRRTGEFRIYRIADTNDDGDALDAGEVSLVLDRPHGGGQIAPLVVREDGVAHREIAVAGLTDPERVSLISESGAVSAIGPAFPSSTDWPANGLSVVGDGQGDLYAIAATRSSNGLAWRVYSLKQST